MERWGMKQITGNLVDVKNMTSDLRRFGQNSEEERQQKISCSLNHTDSILQCVSDPLICLRRSDRLLSKFLVLTWASLYAGASSQSLLPHRMQKFPRFSCLFVRIKCKNSNVCFSFLGWTENAPNLLVRQLTPWITIITNQSFLCPEALCTQIYDPQCQ